MTRSFKNSNPEIVIGNFPWYEMLWRNWRGDFQPRHAPANGYISFAKAWTQTVDFELISRNHDQALFTWLGHVSMLLQVAHKNFLIDPTLASHAGPFGFFGAKRMVPPVLHASQLPRIDYVLISHNHYDHLCDATIRALLDASQEPEFFVPKGLKDWFTKRGIHKVTELDWMESVVLNEELKIYFTPAQHWSRRGLFDTNQSLWGGYLIERHYLLEEFINPAIFNNNQPWRFYFPGDTGYSNDFKNIRQSIGPVDFVALPIGAYLPRDFMKNMHINPEEAVQIMLDLGAQHAVGVHWGTFKLTQESFDQPPKDLALALQKKNLDPNLVTLLKHGQSITISS